MNYNKSNKGLRAIAVFLAIVLVLAAVVGVIAYFSDWFTDWSKFQPEQQEEQLPANENGETASGAFVSEGESNGIKMMTAKIAAADYDEYGISPMAETAYQLTATITPSNAENQAVVWTVAFSNPSSSWATGKSVTNYVTVTPTAEGARTANVECKGAFSEPIVVTVACDENLEIKANCTVDYMKRITSESNFGFSRTDGPGFDKVLFGFTDSPGYPTTFEFRDFKYTDGTVDPEIEVTRFEVGLTEEFLEAHSDIAAYYERPVIEESHIFEKNGGYYANCSFEDLHTRLFTFEYNSTAFNVLNIPDNSDAIYVSVSFNLKYDGVIMSSDKFTKTMSYSVGHLYTPVEDVSLSDSSLVF